MVDDDRTPCRIPATRRRCMIELPYEKPEDFQKFWLETTAEAMEFPLKVSNFRVLQNLPSTHEVETFSFAGVSGKVRHGWLAYPEGARSLPGFLWVPPYGRESKLPDEYGTRTGMVSLSFNFHGEDAFHLEAYKPERGYFAEGAEDPESWIFRSMYQDAVIALRILHAQVQVNENQIGVAGMSQGGGMGVWLGAWMPLVKAVCAEMPFMCGMGNTVKNYAHRFPLKELADFMNEIPIGEQRIMNTISYFDTVFQAEYCSVPTHVTVGLKDPSARVPNVQAMYEALAGTKHLETIDWGHDWHPSMVMNTKRWFFQNF